MLGWTAEPQGSHCRYGMMRPHPSQFFRGERMRRAEKRSGLVSETASVGSCAKPCLVLRVALFVN